MIWDETTRFTFTGEELLAYVDKHVKVAVRLENEACAMLCEEYAELRSMEGRYGDTASDLADRIRARGEVHDATTSK